MQVQLLKGPRVFGKRGEEKTYPKGLNQVPDYVKDDKYFKTLMKEGDVVLAPGVEIKSKSDSAPRPQSEKGQ